MGLNEVVDLAFERQVLVEFWSGFNENDYFVDPDFGPYFIFSFFFVYFTFRRGIEAGFGYYFRFTEVGE